MLTFNTLSAITCTTSNQPEWWTYCKKEKEKLHLCQYVSNRLLYIPRGLFDWVEQKKKQTKYFFNFKGPFDQTAIGHKNNKCHTVKEWLKIKLYCKFWKHSKFVRIEKNFWILCISMQSCSNLNEFLLCNYLQITK